MSWKDHICTLELDFPRPAVNAIPLRKEPQDCIIESNIQEM